MSDNMLVYKLKKNVSMKKVMLLVGGLAFLILFLFIAGKLNPIVHFPDLNFEHVILENLDQNQAPIYRTDLQKITHLDASNMDIESLEGLQYLRNLTDLNLDNNRVTDVTPLSDLQRLVSLELRGNQVSDLQGFELLTSLRYLDLRENHLNRIDEIQMLHTLERLNLRENNISDLNPLKNLDQLSYLNLHSNPQVESIAPLQNLSSLEVLILKDIDIGDDIIYLENLTNLNRINLQNTSISDVSSLKSMAFLSELDLSYNQLTSIESLSGLSRLKVLNLRNNDLSSIDSLIYATDLEYLNIHSNKKIESVDVIKNFRSLETLSMRYVTLEDQEYIFNDLADLETLNVSDTNISDPSPIEELYLNGGLRGEVRGVYLRNALTTPQISLEAGFYQNQQVVEISNLNSEGEVFYTLDGSEPTTNSALYEEPLTLTSRYNEATILRTKVINGFLESDTVTNSYFIHESIDDRFELPVISISTDDEYLFDSNTGIYHDDNYNNGGRDWEPPVSFEFFPYGSESRFVQEAGLRIHGGATREYDQKSLRLISRIDYSDREYFTYNFFENSPSDFEFNHYAFGEIILRNAGNDNHRTMFRDGYIHSLTEIFSDVPTSAYQPAVVFLNGEYWGLYNIREKYNGNYLDRHYGINDDDFTILEDNALLSSGLSEGQDSYIAFRSLMESYEYITDEQYESILKKIDISNLIDYLIIQTFVVNMDWPQNNILYWQSYSDANESNYTDGKWRWMLWDTDFGFGRFKDSIEPGSGHPSYNMLDWIFSEHNLRHNEAWPNIITSKLRTNDQFSTAFYKRYIDVLNHYFSEEILFDRFNELSDRISHEMIYQIERWVPSGTISQWHEYLQQVKDFINDRKQYVYNHLSEEFDLGGQYELRIDLTELVDNDSVIKLNSIQDINNNAYLDESRWIGIYYSDLTLSLEIEPSADYVFSHWEYSDQKNYESNINVSFSDDVTIKPVLIPKQQ